ncbi:MAG: pyruvate kinase [Planctomycetota bacterium]
MVESRYYRHTKIIATIGPSTQSDERLRELIRDGVDVMRLNMAHGDRPWVTDLIRRVRTISSELGRDVAIMMDVKGPEIRTGAVEQPIPLSVGDRVRLCTGRAAAGDLDSNGVREVSVNYPDLPSEVDAGKTVLVDSGLLRWKVIECEPDSVLCEVLTSGVLDSRRHINLPGVQVNLPALTDKDESDLRFGVEAGIDFVALSFVREAADVVTLRDFLQSLGSKARIIAKIEEQAGVRNMDTIVREADAIMVARGDLGIEIDYQKLPLVQTQLVRACHAEGKPVIIATQLLESMIHSPMPTRAEISDVSNAVRERADAVMLSGETTTGKYPLESVGVLTNIIESIEPTVRSELNTRITLHEPKSKMLRSAVVLARELGDSGIIVFTRSGFLAYILGALRARGVPIYAFTDVETTFRQLVLPWGVEPFLMKFSDDPEETIRNALECLKEKGWCRKGTWLVAITNALADKKVIDSMQLRQVD